MTSTFNIEESNGALKIIVKPKPSFILKFGVWFFYAIPFAFFIPTVFYAFVNFHSSHIDVQFLWGLTLLTLSTLFVVAFLRRLYEKEIITVTDTSLILATKFLFKK